ncbi:MAG TPA: GNAT family N-acetyltransferase [Fimbriiglobus sp.]|jgi:ribosomal protein S18 acetylase RimI-like enzyme
MSAEPDFYYFHKPNGPRPVKERVEFLPVQEFLADEPACKAFWNLLVTQFNTRSKFLAIWPGVRYVALHRNPAGAADGFLLVTCPVNWQIDYVVVDPESRGRGIAAALVAETLNRAYEHRAPYVMLTSKASLRPMYEAGGFTVVPVA